MVHMEVKGPEMDGTSYFSRFRVRFQLYEQKTGLFSYKKNNFSRQFGNN